MVKGIARRVVLVRPEGDAPFEQAIFLLRGNAEARTDILREACTVAERYLYTGRTGRRYTCRRYTLWQMLAAAGVGALVMAIVLLAIFL